MRHLQGKTKVAPKGNAGGVALGTENPAPPKVVDGRPDCIASFGAVVLAEETSLAREQFLRSRRIRGREMCIRDSCRAVKLC